MPVNSEFKISLQEATTILFNLYGLEAILKPLPGEIDYNFKVNDSYILKISRIHEDEDVLDFQQNLLEFLNLNTESLTIPKIIKDKNQLTISEITDSQGNKRFVRLLTWVPGRLWSQVNPQLSNLRYSLGNYSGKLTNSLLEFKHPMAHRFFVWDIAQSLWTKNHIDLFTAVEKEILLKFQNQFENSQSEYSKLRKSVVHNDANDNNIIVSYDLKNPYTISVIDFGDAIYTQTINDLAVTCTYAIMGHNDPLEAALPIIKGYNDAFKLTELELKYLYNCIAMRLVISVTKSAINKIEEPNNSYLLVSEKPAWDLLKKWHLINPDFAYYSFRYACGFTAHPNEKVYNIWAKQQSFKFTELFPTINKNDIHLLDLSVSSTWIGHEQDFNDLEYFQYKINKLQQQVPNKIIAGGYLEPRPIYTASAYDKVGNYGNESRTIHLGIDFWLPEYTPVHAMFDGEVVIAVNDAGHKEYGGLVVLKHQINTIEFYTLYGHLSVESATKNKIGDFIKKNEFVGCLGNPTENGEWAAHLHFQIMLSLLDYMVDFPGVAYNRQIDVWKSICVNPNLLFKSDSLNNDALTSNQDLINYRKQHLGKSLSLQYDKPIKMVRGAGVYLLDQFGQKYLDTVNNVAHVGHEHPNVVSAGQNQMALINTNTRYLHENINTLAKSLLETLPAEISVIHIVNSGSEANELAIRMAKAYTSQQDIIVSEFGYHGNTNKCVDISSYKFDGKGGKGAPEYTHVFPIPDAFKGKHTGVNSAKDYAKEVELQIEKVHNKGRGVAAFIIEPIISCGGQVELPNGFLTQAYQLIKNAGGVCISDEVQTGCGRMGKTFWGFQLHNVIPDIITIGKPLGNGHPVAAVACTQAIADQFANGMEYFNTFGGNPVSCAIGNEVLKTIKRENLQENALKVGDFLKLELRKLSIKFPIIGDVRGEGLFLGIELVDGFKNPLTEQTKYLVNRMRDYHILMSIDGPDNNVLKIKPPLVFSKNNAEELILYLEKIFSEDFMLTFKSINN